MTPIPKDPSGTSRLAWLLRTFNRCLRERTPLPSHNMELVHTSTGFFYRPKSKGGGGKSSDPPTVKQFSFVRMGNDIIVCRPLSDTGVVTATDTAIAKPFRLRRTPFDNVGIGGLTYVYINGNQRKVTAFDRVERQNITPAYMAGDIIFAVNEVEGFGDDGHPYQVQGETAIDDGRVEWLDLNLDGRAWSSKFKIA